MAARTVKNATKKQNKKLKIAKKEPIVTRNTTVEQKRQLRTMDRSMKSITQLLKSSPRTVHPKSPKKVTKSSPVKQTLEKDKIKKRDVDLPLKEAEYHPEKLKRKLASKKITLRPLHQLKIIAEINKRKRGTPLKGVHSPLLVLNSTEPSKIEPSSAPHTEHISELSMADVIRAMDETDSLTDEDLMEILTCPSPVWWEDPPDGYDEEPILVESLVASKPDAEKQTSNENKSSEIVKSSNQRTSNADTPVFDENLPLKIDIKSTNIKSVEKRKKLENILGGIRSKNKDNDPLKAEPSQELNEEDLSDISINEDNITLLENLDIPIEKETAKPRPKRKYCNTRALSEIIPLDVNAKKIDNDDKVPEVLPKKLPSSNGIKVESPMLSCKVETAESDSISDKNIRFLVEDVSEGAIDVESQVNAFVLNNKVTVTKSIDKDLPNVGSKQGVNDYITIYKIVSSPEGKTNRNRKRRKVQDQRNNIQNRGVSSEKCIRKFSGKAKSDVSTKTSLLVANKNKYCFKCSSIFDMDECTYCLRTEKLDKTNSTGVQKTHASFKYICITCPYQARTKKELKQHVANSKCHTIVNELVRKSFTAKSASTY